ncbi:DUF92 domain-containing protein [Inquilinus sp. KBS0705]|nr:DUF92 domain-containing protein [Inquilinus sp. KBS0705]
MSANHLVFVFVLIVIMFASYKAGKLTLAGTLTGGVVALFIFLGAGFTGISMLGVFFVLSTLATSWKKNRKQATSDSEKRNTGQVLANGAIAALFGLLMKLVPDVAPLFGLLMAAAFASAIADTLSSELGMVYGRRFYNIISLRPDKKGYNGVISIEGTLIGVVGSAIIAIIYGLGFGFDIGCWYIVIAGTIGNLTDSALGATLERKDHLNNDAVNFANTGAAALSCWLLTLL